MVAEKAPIVKILIKFEKYKNRESFDQKTTKITKFLTENFKVLGNFFIK